HDYLVHSLRDWLTRKQRETRRGRAELLLEERAALWFAKPDDRLLPSIREWASLRLLTQPKGWTEPQRRMMNKARRKHLGRILAFVVLSTLLAWVGMESYRAIRAASLVEALASADTEHVRNVLAQLAPYRRWVDPALRRLLRDSPEDSREHFHA